MTRALVITFIALALADYASAWLVQHLVSDMVAATFGQVANALARINGR